MLTIIYRIFWGYTNMGSLVLTRRHQQSIYIMLPDGRKVEVGVDMGAKVNALVKLRVSADNDINIVRRELLEKNRVVVKDNVEEI